MISEYFNTESTVNFTATQISDAIEASGDSPTHVFLPEIWELVKAYTALPEHTLLKEEPTLRPLYEILFRFGRHLPISNFFSETMIKTLLKTLHPTQRRCEATASRWLAALHRDPARLFRLTDALVQWARGVLGHSQRRRLVPRAAVPQVERHHSILGLGEGFDVPVVEHSTELPDLSEEVDDTAQEAEGDDEEEEAEEAALVGRLMSELDTPGSLQYLQQSITQKRSKLQKGAIISLAWTTGGVDGAFFLARVLSVPKTERAWTFQVEWFDEVEPNVYELDKRWKKSSAPLKDILDTSPPLKQLPGEDRWSIRYQTDTAPPTSSASEPASEAAPARASKPASRLAAPTASKQSKPAAKTAARPAAKSAAKPATRPAAKPATKPATDMLSEAERLLQGAAKVRSDRPILTTRNSEWLNDCQKANDNAIVMRPANAPVYFQYPRSEPMAAEQFTRATIKRLAEASPQSSASVVLPYSVQQLHWHELFFSFLERCVYHFEGLGAELPAVSPIRIAFDASLGSQGWQLVSLCDEYQSDGSSCGVWLQAARDAWLRYVASTDHGSKIFAAFLRRTFEAAGVHSLSSLRGRVLGAAQRGNEAYILGQCAAMRSRLVHAALAEKLSWGSASLAGFAPATAVNLDSFDEQPNDAMV